MTRAEFLAIQKDLQNQLYDCGSHSSIEVGFDSTVEYAIGCFYDENDNKWKMYVNRDRGWHSIWFESENEEKVFDKLYSYILSRIKYGD